MGDIWIRRCLVNVFDPVRSIYHERLSTETCFTAANWFLFSLDLRIVCIYMYTKTLQYLLHRDISSRVVCWYICVYNKEGILDPERKKNERKITVSRSYYNILDHLTLLSTVVFTRRHLKKQTEAYQVNFHRIYIFVYTVKNNMIVLT